MTNITHNYNTLPDAELSDIIIGEQKKQKEFLTLIASENYITPSLLHYYRECLLFNNKYAEGYPGKRYYGGCDYVDQVENLAIERAKQLFGVEYANVQPHSGSQANAAVFMALLSPNDSFLGMSLSHGGHLTHGSKISFSGHFYKAISYGVDKEGWIDYEAVEKLAKQYHPKLIIAGCSAYSRIIDWQRFREIADQVGAYLLADVAHIAGLIVADVYPSPVSFAHVITTSTHKTLRGPRGGMIIVPRLDFAKARKIDRAVFPGIQGGPLVHVVAAKAAAFHEALQPSFKRYQMQVIRNAKAMAEALQRRGFKVVTHGTDSHLFLVDLSQKSFSGKTAESRLERAHIITNKNMLPDDTRSATETSGLRLGTPAMTTWGCKEEEAREIAQWIADTLDNIEDELTLKVVKEKVVKLLRSLPFYSNDV